VSCRKEDLLCPTVVPSNCCRIELVQRPGLVRWLAHNASEAKPGSTSLVHVPKGLPLPGSAPVGGRYCAAKLHLELDYYGDDLVHGTHLTSLHECCQHCLNNVGCTAWSFKTNNAAIPGMRSCFLKKGKVRAMHRHGQVSGLVLEQSGATASATQVGTNATNLTVVPHPSTSKSALINASTIALGVAMLLALLCYGCFHWGPSAWFTKRRPAKIAKSPRSPRVRPMSYVYIPPTGSCSVCSGTCQLGAPLLTGAAQKAAPERLETSGTST